WPGTGSGCSAYIPKPSWQHDPGCANRTVVDVAFDGDPNTGVAVYDSFRDPGWLIFGGTSVGAPAIAAIYALAGNAATVTDPAHSPLGGFGSHPYGHTSALFDITVGNDGTCSPGPSYLCTARAGYDGPSGLGTPRGVKAF